MVAPAHDAAPTDSSPEHIIAFNALPATVRARFVEAVAAPPEEGGPVRELSGAAFGSVYGEIVVSVVVLAGMVGISAIGFGEVYGGDPLQHVGWLVLGWIPLAALFAIYVLGAVISARDRRRLPTAPGIFLFPFDLVRFRDDCLHITHLIGIETFETTHHLRNGFYQDTTIDLIFPGGRKTTLTVHGKEKARLGLEAWLVRREAAQHAMAGILGNDDPIRHREHLALLHREDPFFEVRMKRESWRSIQNPANLTPTDAQPPFIVPLPLYLRRMYRAALAVALVLGPAGWLLRNKLSDDAAWTKTCQAGSLRDIDNYLEHGRWHRAEAETARPAWAFAEAKTKNTVTAYRSFIEKYGSTETKLTAEAEQRIHGFYQAARERFARQMKEPLPVQTDGEADEVKAPSASDDARLVATVGQILDWVEMHRTATFPVYFMQPQSTDLQEADIVIAGYLAALGDHSKYEKMAPYFGKADSERREEQIVASLKQAMATIFPNDVLSFVRAPKNPPPDQPALIISWVMAPARGLFESERRDATFGSFRVSFVGGFRLPGSSLKPGELAEDFADVVEPPEKFSVHYMSYRSPYSLGGTITPGLVYDTMAQRAFDRFASRLCRRFHLAPVKVETQDDPLRRVPQR